MTRSIELTGSGLKLPYAGGDVTLALAGGPSSVTVILADPCALVGTPPTRQPVAVDYSLDLTAAEHLRERLAIVIAEAKHLAAADQETVEPAPPPG